MGIEFHTKSRRTEKQSSYVEVGASEQTIKAIAGHVSQRMLDRYSHIRLEAKRAALEALSRNGGYVTTNVTRAAQEQPLSTQTIDSNGRRVRI